LVAVHRGDDRMLQAQQRNRFGDPLRFGSIEDLGLPRLHRAEAAAPGADVSKDHERGGAVVPALPHVRASRLLTDRMQPVGVDDCLEARKALASRNPGLEPLGPAPRARSGPGRFYLLEDHITWFSSKFSSSLTIRSRKEPPSAPSMMRWSNASVK